MYIQITFSRSLKSLKNILLVFSLHSRNGDGGEMELIAEFS